ncbi:lantibiotic dehydratase C-terminal domain-containing protein [Actinokineospora guangxiensis]|uniref:Lantibiotic dehydratase C-terminal domain-containing protein n=1 Tax=Actinokineospora guangxiensis TaxID=1490288 RepID=A0ABW0EUL5_9PSEU
MAWTSLHLHHHGGETEAMIRDVAAPLCDASARMGTPVYMFPHWRQGDHVRVNVDAGPRVLRSVLHPLADRLMAEYSHQFPSAKQRPTRARMAADRRRAALEDDRGPLLPWAPDNRVVRRPHEDRSSAVGTVPAALVRANLVATNDLALRTRLGHVGATARRALAFDLLVVTALRFGTIGLRHAYLCFRSHAEGFLTTFPEARSLRAQWRRVSKTTTQALAERVEALAGGAVAEAAELWATATGPSHAEAAELAESGALRLERTTERLAVSPFHTAMGATPAFREHVEGQSWYSAYRVALNLAYLHLTRVGLAPADRFLICHLVADAVERAFDLPGTEPAE